MPVCPACDAENLPGSPSCRKCGLSTELFDPIRAAVGVPKGSPEYGAHVRALLEAMGDLAIVPPDGPEGRTAAPPRFLSTPGPSDEPAPGPAGLSKPVLPKRSSGPSDPAACRREIEGLLELERRDAGPGTAIDERARGLLEHGDAGELEAFAGELFVRVGARLTDRYGAELARRGELAEILPTGEVDALLSSARMALAAGKLDEADVQLRRAGDLLERLEEDWGTTEVLLRAADDLAETARQLGGDPGPALGPVEEARRRARGLDRAGAEPLLARATVGLWTILNPLLERDLARRIDEVRAHRAAGADVEAVVADLREFAVQVQQSNFSAAVAFYRRGVDRLAALGEPGAAPAAPINSDPSVPPA